MVKEYEILLNEQPHQIIISDQPPVLLAAKAAGRTVIGLWDSQKNSEDFAGTCDLGVDYLIEDIAAVTEDFLEKVARRQQGLPWTIFENAQICLRELTPADWETVKEALEMLSEQERADTQLPWLKSRPHFLAYISHQYAFYEYGLWVIEDRQSRRPAGLCGLWNFAEVPEEAFETGYLVFPPFRGRGYAALALRASLNYAKQWFKVPVYAKIREENIPSRTLIKRCGFRLCPRPKAPKQQSGPIQLLYQYAGNLTQPPDNRDSD